MKLGKKRKKRSEYIKQKQGYDDNISFYLLNEYVLDLLMNEDLDLPHKDLDKEKDQHWNMKQLTSRILRGILNGDPIDVIAVSLLGVVNNNKAASIRIARTLVTECENEGRLASYRYLASQGVIQKKQWMATPDSRTRDSHVMVDGEEVDIDEKFSNGLMYPGDPEGKPAEVYNCRCTMVDTIVGFRRPDGSISYVNDTPEETTHEPQMRAEKRRRGM
jgi:SPP1 gp7 family putative phage head morphogenesis protein